MNSALVDLVRNYLSSHSMFVDDDWITGCVEFLSGNNYSDQEIKNSAREQWLLNDLKDICPGCLPPNLKDMKKIQLDGRYALQINAVIDIGTPAYQQYLKLQKVNMENIEATINNDEKIPSHRMLKLYLTDGVQDISAIEYNPMRNLSCDITPGCKIYVKGPVECRRGVLLLTEKNIELLGGEVDSMAITNSVAGVITSKLGLVNDTGHTTQSTIRSNATKVPNTASPVNAVRNEFHQSTFDAASTETRTAPQTNFIEDDFETDILLAEVDAQVIEHSGKRPLNGENTNPEKKIKIDSIPNRNDDFPDDNDIFFDEDLDYLRDMEEELDARDNEIQEVRHKGPITVCADPFVYIKQINELNVTERAGRVFRVKAQIIKLLSKLSVGKEGWSLRCTIVDGTGSLDVDFASNVLSELVGFTPEEMQSIKKQIATNPEMKEKAVSALQKAKDTLQVLYCIIEVTMQEVPKITSLVPFENSHVDLLIKRIQDSGL
ncbi:recQ-mediated genome instability protein 1-like [Galleria mellonella]|uniref:RecQ-mediated genome instability protein 1 n=1 Tax=Galleria mellonella TaxID=7137 RepID=A0A6J1WUU9_GALME|nr:recQ-mediated genome instability protein 1-like [Galleria mellonella]